jgi:hypothetical protein
MITGVSVFGPGELVQGRGGHARLRRTNSYIASLPHCASTRRVIRSPRRFVKGYRIDRAATVTSQLVAAAIDRQDRAALTRQSRAGWPMHLNRVAGDECTRWQRRFLAASGWRRGGDTEEVNRNVIAEWFLGLAGESLRDEGDAWGELFR